MEILFWIIGIVLNLFITFLSQTSYFRRPDFKKEYPTESIILDIIGGPLITLLLVFGLFLRRIDVEIYHDRSNGK